MPEPQLFKTKSSLSLNAATDIVDGALAAAREHGMEALSVAVLDAGGHLVAFKREDGAGHLRPEVAMGKAWGALGMGAAGRTLRERMTERAQFVSALANASQGRFFPVPGGVLVLDDDGFAVGAVGISGDASEKDEYAAIMGIRAAGLKSEPAEPDPQWRSAKL